MSGDSQFARVRSRLIILITRAGAEKKLPGPRREDSAIRTDVCLLFRAFYITISERDRVVKPYYIHIRRRSVSITRFV